MSAVLVALVVGVAQPASASGGATISVRADGVWRTQTFTVSDATIPSACPGPTTQKLSVTATIKGTSTGWYIQSIYLTNTTSGVTFSTAVKWDERVKYASPRFESWGYGKKKLLTSLVYPSTYQTLSSYQTWSSSRGIHVLVLENGGGTGCWPVFQIVANKV